MKTTTTMKFGGKMGNELRKNPLDFGYGRRKDLGIR